MKPDSQPRQYAVYSLTVICLSFISAISQLSASQNNHKEIDAQVWRPFIQSFGALDAEGFLDVHSKDLVRSGRESNQILNWTGYLAQTREGNNRTRSDGSRRTIELRFTERLANDSQAIDVGIYKTTMFPKQGNSRSFYGRFHVVLRKEGNTWKILVDTDSSEGGTISEKDFLAAKPLQ